MKKTAKKLTLAKETVRTLVGEEMAAAQGGAIYTQYNCQVWTSDCGGVIADSRRIC
ncbi:MAG TPA: class I lanthipeptide [Thermoanaerobaculia bacterium]|nr:class I lanthipeptide [Thermoanaerobaculia bacterium]